MGRAGEFGSSGQAFSPRSDSETEGAVATVPKDEEAWFVFVAHLLDAKHLVFCENQTFESCIFFKGTPAPAQPDSQHNSCPCLSRRSRCPNWPL